jgi:hypothetical protein
VTLDTLQGLSILLHKLLGEFEVLPVFQAFHHLVLRIDDAVTVHYIHIGADPI